MTDKAAVGDSSRNAKLNGPLAMIAAGAFVMMMSYVYWVGMVGSRIHEKSPELVGRMQTDRTIAMVGIFVGGAVFLAGVVVAVVRLLRARRGSFPV